MINSKKIIEFTNLSKLSHDAYIYTRVKKIYNKNIKNINNRAIYYQTDDTQYIIVRGSMFKKCINDWNIIANMKPYKLGEYYFHGGYYQEAKNINKEVSKLLRRDLKTYYIGHSAGGCISSIVSLLNYDINPTNTKIVTFGQPKYIITEKEFPYEYNRIVHKLDPIPKLPLLIYNHIGKEILIGQDKKIENINIFKYHELKKYYETLLEFTL